MLTGRRSRGIVFILVSIAIYAILTELKSLGSNIKSRSHQNVDEERSSFLKGWRAKIGSLANNNKNDHTILETSSSASNDPPPIVIAYCHYVQLERRFVSVNLTSSDTTNP